ncbi:MAG: hypothetical protein HYY90_02340 [Candidatus Omnitrophica bacterium]|nr:hypothetical protein [Candidatus Omnitrophota bacterium]MBI3083192.1 hypothetical protein [Candidatus Omnitrophota bacterium]
MRVLKSILRDSLTYYQRLERDLTRRLARLPQGSVKRRRIRGHAYYYRQWRNGGKVVHRYLGRRKPVELLKGIRERRQLNQELAKARAALRLLPRRKLAA